MGSFLHENDCVGEHALQVYIISAFVLPSLLGALMPLVGQDIESRANIS